jgi:gas vesicle protein
MLGLAIGAASSIFGAMSSGKKAREARAKSARLQRKLEGLEASRQELINPYDDVKSLAGMAVDMSSQMTNTYANIGVATQAAEMQIEEADIALANTLDTLRATGSGAGGATALAQAAMRSKKEVSASIEKQEAGNEKLRAQGEDQLQQSRLAESKRIQGINISEGAREQSADAQGQAFQFNATEARQNQQLNRVAGQLANSQQNAANQESNQTAAWMNLAGNAAKIVDAL